MGPLISAPHRAKVLGYIDSGVAQKATLRIDGRGLKVAGHEQGYFVGPTLFDHVTPAMTIYQEEIFGPVLSVVRIADYRSAVDLINRHEYGNGTAIFTRDGVPHAASVRRYRWGWSASTCRSQYRWRFIASAAGNVRFSGRSTCMAMTGCASTRG